MLVVILRHTLAPRRSGGLLTKDRRYSCDPRVAIFLKELAAPVRIDKTVVAEAFRLTRREAEVAALIGAGYDLERIAGVLDMGLATVRSHLKRVFGKTGMHRQSALASLIRGLADPSSR
jgi:DNA-binding CsgD family transcriptional regulator